MYVDRAARGKTGESDDSGADEFYTYDPAGNVVQHLTKRGHSITLSYDALVRMTRRAARLEHGAGVNARRRIPCRRGQNRRCRLLWTKHCAGEY